MKKIISLLVIAILSIGMLTACNKATGTVSTVSTVSSGKVTITVADLMLSDVGLNEFTKKKQAEFDSLYGKDIKIEHILPVASSEINAVQSLSTILISRDAPAYVPVSSTIYMKDLYNMGLAKDVTSYLKDNATFKKMYTSAQESVKYSNDKIIGWPGSLEIPLLGFYNEALKEAGYNPDSFSCKTWDEYFNISKKMTTAAHSGASLYASEFYLWPNNWFLSNGAQVAVQNADGTISLNYTDEKVLQTVEFFRKLYSNGLTNSNINYTDVDNMFTLIYKKAVASFTMYPTWISNFVNAGIDPDEITLKPFPMGPSGSYESALYVSGYVFNSKLTDKQMDATIKYITFMSDEAYYNEYFKFCLENSISELRIPPYASVDWYSHLTDFPDTWISAIKGSLATAKSAALNSTAHSTYLSAILPEIISKKVDVKATLQKAEAKTKSEWLDSFNTKFTSGK